MNPDNIRQADGLLWLIIGVFWVIAQIAGGAKKNQRRRPPTVPGESPGPVVEDPLTEILRKLSGDQPIDEPQLEEVVPSAPPPPASKSAWTPQQLNELPDRVHRLDIPVEQHPIESFDLPFMDARPTMKAFRSASASFKQPSMNLSDGRSNQKSKTVPMHGKLPGLKNKQELRRAMIYNIILSPPKALEKS